MAKKNKFKSIITLLDIGTSKICCMIVKFSADGTPEIIGTGYTPACGIQAGAIIDKQQATECISNALAQARKQADFRPKNVVVNISSTQMKSHHIFKEIEISDNKPISANDVKSLVDKVISSCLAQKDEVIHAFPLEYVVDNYEQFDQGNILEEFVSILHRNQIIFLILLTMEFSLSTFLFFVTWQHREHSIKLIQHLYKEIGLNTTRIVFYILFALACGINTAFYPLGFYSLYTKKFKLLGYFANFALVTGVLTIFVVYINMLFLLVFILRLVIYTLARFICNLIISIIVFDIIHTKRF